MTLFTKLKNFINWLLSLFRQKDVYSNDHYGRDKYNK